MSTVTVTIYNKNIKMGRVMGDHRHNHTNNETSSESFDLIQNFKFYSFYYLILLVLNCFHKIDCN